jgi:hypothetical protein
MPVAGYRPPHSPKWDILLGLALLAMAVLAGGVVLLFG